MEVIKRTPIGKSYLQGEGAYQNELDELNKSMPAIGGADTLNGELVRAVNRLYYDYSNNGNCNALNIDVYEVETGYEDEDGNIEYDEEEERTWNPYYEKFFGLIVNTCECALTGEERLSFINNMSRLEDIVLYCDPSYSDKELQVYDYMVDVVVWYVLNHEDKPLPEGYVNK